MAMLVFCAWGCDNSVSFEDQMAIDRDIILEYAADNNLQGEFTDLGTYYIIEDAGSGSATPAVTSVIDIYYEGQLLDGTQFDQSGGFPAQLQMWNLIRGWQDGLANFKKDSKGVLLIPSRLAYGADGRKNQITDEYIIPPDAVLRFNVELVDFN